MPTATTPTRPTGNQASLSEGDVVGVSASVTRSSATAAAGATATDRRSGRGGGAHRRVHHGLTAVHHPAVPHPHQPFGGGGHIVGVGDEDDRLAALVQAVEQFHDLLTAFGVERACR